MVSDADRRLLDGQAEQATGREAPDVLLDSLPPAGWTDVATKADVAMLRTDLRGEIAELRGELAGLRGELHLQMARLARQVVFTVAALVR